MILARAGCTRMYQGPIAGSGVGCKGAGFGLIEMPYPGTTLRRDFGGSTDDTAWDMRIRGIFRSLRQIGSVHLSLNCASRFSRNADMPSF